MKRHESLIPLSREHHDGLILAQLIKLNAPVYKGMPETTADKVKYASKFYRFDLIEHFKKEEEMLRKIKLANEAIDQLAVEIEEEHRVLQRLFSGLENSTDQEAVLNELGILLEAHIRKEERILFPLIEKYCSAEVMEALRPLLT